MRLVILIVLVLCTCSISKIFAQTTKDFAVLASAVVQKSPLPTIQLKWDKHPNQTSMLIWRKKKSESVFASNPNVTLDSNAVTWTDSAVVSGESYEYRLIRDIVKVVGTDTNTGNPIYAHVWGFGFVWSGIEAAPAYRGTVLVLVDTTMVGPLAKELATFTEDLESDGWTVRMESCDRAENFNAAAVGRVRQQIKNARSATKNDLNTVVLVGRVPVPYSGNIAPDGHGDHVGAWPADGIYGDVFGTYTDASINARNASRPANENLPDDGKFDQSFFASNVVVAVGRIDMYNLPVFPSTELDLLKRYFDKNHAFRIAQYGVKMGGIIDDNFGGYGDRFAASGWRSFSVFGGDTAVKAGDFLTSVAGPETILFNYGCDGGTDTSAGGVATSSQLASKQIFSVFTTLFGSYHGDYNTQNNLMRSALATQPRALTCSWSGRPHWYIHHMGLGETYGYSTLISQNNSSIMNSALGTYAPNVTFNGTSGSLVSIGDRGVHIALLGDPTLRAVMKPIAPVATLSASYLFPNKVKVQWNRPSPEVTAFMVYRKRATQLAFQLLTPKPTTNLEITDSLLYEGQITYRVQSCVLRTTASGSYYDVGKASETVVTSTDLAEQANQFESTLEVAVSPNPIASSAQIRVTLERQGPIIATLISVTGSVVWQIELPDCAAGSHLLGFDTEDNTLNIPVGRYILTVASGLAKRNVMISVVR
ncbi:MAG: hypothetical protein HQ472_04270 [Ignavibacteria bacterium]|nr:hypothetical protein [Ignavibacteria bacterium]